MLADTPAPASVWVPARRPRPAKAVAHALAVWHSADLAQAVGYTSEFLVAAWQKQEALPLAHDHLFHTLPGLSGLLDLLDLRIALYEPERDFTAGCRTAQVAGAR